MSIPGSIVDQPIYRNGEGKGKGMGETLPDGFSILDDIDRRNRREPDNVEKSLSTGQFLQYIAMGLRNEVQAAIARGIPGHMVTRRGAQNREGVIEKAIELEQLLGANQNSLVISALYAIKAQTPGEKGPREVADAIYQGIINKRPLRGDNANITPEVAKILLAVFADNEPYRTIVEGMIESNLAAMELLDRDKSFPSIISNAAFHRRLSENPSRGTFAFADLCDFKDINDKYSQNFIDKTLLEPLCVALSKAAREKGKGRILVCRKNGDEFLIDIRDYDDDLAMGRFISRVFYDCVNAIDADLVRKNLAYLNADFVKECGSPDVAVARVVESYRNVQCKIGIKRRAKGADTQAVEAEADALAGRAKPYKTEVSFPMALESCPDFIFDGLSHPAVEPFAIDGRKAKPRTS